MDARLARIRTKLYRDRRPDQGDASAPARGRRNEGRAARCYPPNMASPYRDSPPSRPRPRRLRGLAPSVDLLLAVSVVPLVIAMVARSGFGHAPSAGLTLADPVTAPLEGLSRMRPPAGRSTAGNAEAVDVRRLVLEGTAEGVLR